LEYSAWARQDIFMPGDRTMGYTIANLQDKIMKMYPEIAQYGVKSNMTFDREKKTYVFKWTP
jgi:hypothetical protein